MTSNLFARHCPQGLPHAKIAPGALALQAKIPGRTPTPSHGNPFCLHATRPALHTINTADHDAKPGRTKIGRAVQVDENLILHAHARSLNKKDDDRCEIHNLEFGLRLRDIGPGGEEDDGEGRAEDDNNDRKPAVGSLTVRANVTDMKDPAKLPGEYLYQLDPGYFDRRRNPPEEQNLEKLYYQPCSGCGRASNDPACRCGREQYERGRTSKSTHWASPPNA